jgi:hypothetical protein
VSGRRKPPTCILHNNIAQKLLRDLTVKVGLLYK